jgi:hypothetical protein
MSRTHTQIMQEVVDKYMASGQPWPATSRQMAEWAIQHNQWMPHRASLVHLCADQLARAMSEEYITDAQESREMLGVMPPQRSLLPQGPCLDTTA